MVHTNNFINGEWEETTDDRIDVECPFNPDDPLWSVPASSAETTDRAIEAAFDASDTWRETPATERGAILDAAADHLESRIDEVAEIQTRETGKPIGNARSEVRRAVETLRYYGQLAFDHEGTTKPSRKENAHVYTRHEPLGVVGVITPWNYPIAIAVWKIAPALATGNTVVQKPASASPRTNAALFEALDAADIPDGVANFVTGRGSVVGDQLVSNDAIDAISFTGSSSVGHQLYESATANGARAQCEMGGKNPIVVDDTADIDRAVKLTMKSAFRYSGQLCVAISRAIVFEEVYDEYVDALTDAVEDLAIGSPLDDATDVGPKISRESMESDLEFVTDAVSDGATVATGGQRVDRDGWFVEPTVITDVDSGDRLAQEEVFGPVLAVIPVADFEEALSVANDVEYGLVASLCTNRLDYARRFADNVEAGMVKVNQTTGFEKQFPFGGWKASSTNTYKEQGREALDFYTKDKTVYLQYFEE